MPGLKIVIPSTPHDAKGLLKAAIRDPDPVIYFEHKKAYRLLKGETPEDDYVVPIGPAALRREGDDLTVISYGLMVHESLAAAEALATDGVEATVLDLRTVAPLDNDAILDAARRTGKVLIVHEDTLSGGIGGEVAASHRRIRLRPPGRAHPAAGRTRHPGDAVQRRGGGPLAAVA